jgi:hypothetical protein
VYLAAGDFDAAIADATRALEMARGLQGKKAHSALTGQALLLMALVQDARGDHELAGKNASEAVPHLVGTLGDGHPDAHQAHQYAQSVARR